MILVDSAIWINHLRALDDRLVGLVQRRQALTHPAVIGELAVGNLAKRRTFLQELGEPPSVNKASDDEVLRLIEQRRLYGRGIGYLDATLLASVLITPGAGFWTSDKRLAAVSLELGLNSLVDH